MMPLRKMLVGKIMARKTSRAMNRSLVSCWLSYVCESNLIKLYSARLKASWRSAVYGFFKADVKVKYDGGRKYHYFKCSARHCCGNGGVRRYQDSKDRAATSNLKAHAVKCFGKDAVDAAFSKGSGTGRDRTIFAMFARPGQQPVKVSHRAHTTDETRYVIL